MGDFQIGPGRDIMNKRLYSIALLVSAIPLISSARSNIKFDKGDFIAAEKITKDGESVVSFKLSKSGKAKIKILNEQVDPKEIYSDIGGVSSNLRVREKIIGDDIEMGPYSSEDAQKVISEINEKKYK